MPLAKNFDNKTVWKAPSESWNTNKARGGRKTRATAGRQKARRQIREDALWPGDEAILGAPGCGWVDRNGKLMLPPSWRLIGALLVLAATAGDSTNKIILPQILNGGGGGVGIAGGKHSSGSKTVVAGFGVPGAGAGAGGGAVVGSGTANTVVGSNGVIVAGGVANVPTSNLNSEYLNFLYLNEY